MIELLNLIPDPTDAILFWGILVISLLLSGHWVDSSLKGDGHQPVLFVTVIVWILALFIGFVLTLLLFDTIFVS